MNVFPSDWCKSVIIPLFKKGDDKILDNYRGISLLWMSGPMSACLESPHYFCSGHSCVALCFVQGRALGHSKSR